MGMRYETQKTAKEKARLERNETRARVEKWMSNYRREYAMEPTLREVGRNFGRSGMWVSVLLRMKGQDEKDALR
jgi:hypothetical protein